MGFLCSLAFSIQFLLLFSSFLFTNCLTLNDSTTTHHHECYQHESNALFSFKQSFIISKYASYNPFSYPKTLSWNPSTDCCLWDGIECDELTGHVISIDLSSSQLYGSMDPNSTLFSLVHLQSLDLSDNDFNHSQIPAKIGELSQLRYLNLSHGNENTFSGEVPPQISQLSNLLSLDLRSYIEQLDFPFINRLHLKESTLRSLIQNSTRLEHLRLNFVTISSSLPHTLTNLTSLQMLSFRRCELYGEFPVRIFHLPNITVLNFGENQNLQGTLPASIGNLTNLAVLYLEDNSFHGEIPQSLFRLKNLEILSLSYNFFEGELALDMILKLKMLNGLDLSFNKLSLFSQNTDVNVTTLPPIQWLGLSECNLIGEVPTWMMNLTSLYHLDLSKNKLQGEIPYFLFTLENLTVLYLGGNMLEGQIELDLLAKLKKLTVLGFGGGNKLFFLEGKNTSNVTIPSQIQYLELSSCNLVHFPNFIQHLQELTDLFISNNSIKTIPSWIWNKTTLQRLEIFNNLLMGEISPLICNLQSLVHLDLSSNNLVGMIPSCLGSFSQSLRFLRLAGNKLIGSIPQTYSKRNALQFIDFSSNKLYGQLPRSLVNCRKLELLDVSHNHLNDSFPFWLQSLPKLKVISLRNNKFYGAIKCPSNCTFLKLHIIDLSQNDFSGNLSSEIIKNFKSMTLSNTSDPAHFKDDIYYLQHSLIDIDLFSFSMSNKGVVLNYHGVQYFDYMVAIDLSCNKIYGEIPDIMGSLNRLLVLNLSNNMFTGSIPSSLGKLSNLEVLDLSLNSLSGNIPQQLTGLTFLDFFNVSFNNLSGPIPENGQLSTFDDNSFKGNNDLCGIQLVKKCKDHSMLPLSTSDGNQDSESGPFFKSNWMVILIGYGGGLLVGLALGNAFAGDVFRLLKRIF
ncbi:receptor-like protein 49 [Arachis hypogaea]|uniref:receptor-like protein 49 n=1 Tax=Arachis hypogaea TaxID=3818 RepID=UPI000DECC47E|nr:receptor-like protein 6 [Arachis hypogaea]QHO09312.1 Receptor-like protein [Arachis hypogaea]